MSEIQNIFEVGQGSTAKNKVSLTIRLYLPICPSDYENSKNYWHGNSHSQYKVFKH